MRFLLKAAEVRLILSDKYHRALARAKRYDDIAKDLDDDDAKRKAKMYWVQAEHFEFKLKHLVDEDVILTGAEVVALFGEDRVY